MKTRTIDFASFKTSAMVLGVATVIGLGTLGQVFADSPNHTHGDMTHAQMSAQCNQHMTEMKNKDQDSDLTDTNHHRS